MDDNTEHDVVCSAINILAHVAVRSLNLFSDISALELSAYHTNSGLGSFLPVMEFLFVIGLITMLAKNEKVQRVWYVIFRIGKRIARRVRSAAIAVAIAAGPVRKAELLHIQMHNPGSTWDLRSSNGTSACYALQGRRPKMEDRFTLVEKLGTTPIQLFAIYDGHGGEFAADFAQKWICQWLEKRIIAQKHKIATNPPEKIEELPRTKPAADSTPSAPITSLENLVENYEQETKTSKDFKQGSSESNAEGNVRLTKTPSVRRKFYFSGQDSQDDSSESQLIRRSSSGKENIAVVRRTSSSSSNTNTKKLTPCNTQKQDLLDLSGELNKAIVESDKALLVEAKKKNDVAGSTALVALLDPVQGRLAVANVGDSRGILCDGKGTVIPLSFDHKPQQLKERRRIQEAGGFIAFNGVWRVAGILATSRALGDFPLKERKLLIAEPDVLSFDLKELKLQPPSFLILASDGLWDAFSNEEAALYVRQRLQESHLGARSLAMQAYQRGSVDNITVLVVNLTNIC